MIIGISALNSKNQDFRKVAALSEALHADAVKYVDELLHTSNLWYLTGEAMCMAVYQLDRAVSISGGCQVALSDEHITTRLPQGGDYISELSERADFERVSHSKERQFLLDLQVCVMKSEMQATQFFDRPVPNHSGSHDDWVQRMDQKIHSLYHVTMVNGRTNAQLSSSCLQCQVMLHRPCSRNIAVSEASLVSVVKAAIDLISLDTKTAESGGLVMVFDIGNRVFQAGMLLLYTLRNYASTLRRASLADNAANALKNLAELPSILSSRWPPLADTASYINKLIDTNLRNPVGHNGSHYDMQVLEELDCLVTQRRIHSIRHRNIPFPPPKKSTPPPSEPENISQDFLNDEQWWTDFTDQDFVSNESCFSLPSGGQVTSTSSSPDAVETRAQRERGARDNNASDLEEELGVIPDASPSCSFCRDRRTKCQRQLPACKECPLETPYSSPPNRSPLLKLEPHHHQTCSATRSLAPGPPSGASEINSATTEPPITTSHQLLRLASRTAIPNPSFQNLITFHPLPETLATPLFILFSRSINTFFPTLEPQTLTHILNTHYHNHAPSHNTTNTPIFNFIIALGALITSKSTPSFLPLAESHFQNVTPSLPTTCAHASRAENLALLQRTLLICVYTLLEPSAGDVWRHLGFAIRLFLDLSHRPSMEEDEDHAVFSKNSKGYHKSHVSIAFGRPSLLVIGDDLRRELVQKSTSTQAEQISISSYLIALLKLQIHNTILQHHKQTNHLSSSLPRDYTNPPIHLRNLPPNPRILVRNLATIHNILIPNNLSSLKRRPPRLGLTTPPPRPLPHHNPLANTRRTRTHHLSGVAQAALQLLRHQQMFASITYEEAEVGTPPSAEEEVLVFPFEWTMSHLVFQVGLRAMREKDTTLLPTSEKNPAQCPPLQQCFSMLLLLEADASKLLRGHSQVFEALSEKINM
ncbi:hypothetical protein CSAL01_08777 [Colletotrichum salicis]|uniref:Zn(2)-C6 fungal-type domain-containing protein n=1 Tax=Colletotrichum salicis TaxID=1209931 RepID=A0A135SQM4_9PEZI|nr:hypothetical protein CSAL01_08777 [Colletotrichum salicis]